MPRMHADEVDTDVALVRRLLADQFPLWAALSIDPVPSWGTTMRSTDSATFCDALSVDDATWGRARGWALSQAVDALSYYSMETNPKLVVEARKWLREALASD